MTKMLDIRNMGCDCVHNSDFVHYRPEGSNAYLMLFVKTKAVFFIDGEPRITEPGTFIIYDLHSAQHYTANGPEYINDWMIFSFTDNIGSIPDIMFDTPVFIGDSVNISSYFRLIADCYYRKRSMDVAAHLIRAMLTDVFAGSEHTDRVNVPHYRELLDLRRDIYAQPGREWSVAEMASSANISQSYLYMLYKQAFGVTCTADLINSRIEHAKHDLLYYDMTIEETAYDCGYKNVEHFSRQFKKITGLAPLAWRQREKA